MAINSNQHAKKSLATACRVYSETVVNPVQIEKMFL